MEFVPSIWLVLAVLGVAVLIYIAPSIIATLRRHSSRNAIILLNLLGGWTGAGWVIAMLWAWTDFGLGRYLKRRRAEAFERDGRPL